MALQELDLHFHYRPGKANLDADLCSVMPDKDDSVAMPWTVVAPIEVVSLAKEGEETLSGRQFADPEIEIIIRFLEEGVLPENDLKAREVTLAKAQ